MTHPDIQATITNVNTGGQWIVIQSITMRHGPFATRAEADEFARVVEGKLPRRTDG